jgi:hypothetical protein
VPPVRQGVSDRPASSDHPLLAIEDYCRFDMQGIGYAVSLLVNGQNFARGRKHCRLSIAPFPLKPVSRFAELSFVELVPIGSKFVEGFLI